MNLRFIIRDGQKILQQYIQTGIVGELPSEIEKVQLAYKPVPTYTVVMEWVDVPLVEGEEE